jgi:CRP-like cAMP-binding protein
MPARLDSLPQNAPQSQWLATLARSPLLASLPRESLSRFVAHTVEIEVPAGTSLLKEGDESPDMYFVLDGEVRLYRNQMSLKVIGPGGHFGALGFLTGRPRSASVVAETKLLLARLSPESWEDLTAGEPALALHLVLGIGVRVAMEQKTGSRTPRMGCSVTRSLHWVGASAQGDIHFSRTWG